MVAEADTVAAVEATAEAEAEAMVEAVATAVEAATEAVAVAMSADLTLDLDPLSTEVRMVALAGRFLFILSDNALSATYPARY